MSESIWDERARKYKTTGFSDFSIAFFDQRMRLFCVEQLLRELGFFDKPQKKLLDFGCGSGDFLEHFSPLFDRAVGCDTSDEILAIAKRRFEKAPNVELTSTLEQIEPGFGIILSITVLQHILDDDELISVLNELHRLLLPKGNIIALESVATSGRDYSFPSYLKARSVGDWEKRFRQAGFLIKSRRPFYNHFYHPTPSSRTYMQRTRAARSMYRVIGKLFGNVRLFNAWFRSAARDVLSSPETADGLIPEESISQFFILEKAGH
jgi:ubiquinone/menaquinone biosynthesis C-methylase UbiE